MSDTINHEEEHKHMNVLMTVLEEQLPKKGIVLIASESRGADVDAKILTNIKDDKFLVTLLVNLLRETGGIELLKREIARRGKH